MFRQILIPAVLLAVLAAGGTSPAAAQALDADTIAAALNTAHPEEAAYVRFVVTLVDQGRLSRKLVESSFLWARRKASRHKKFQYFKHAVIAQAAQFGITLPQETPDLTPTIHGQVVLRVLLLDLPAANITVTIRGTGRETVTDANGQFTFENVPLGTYTLDATGFALLLPRRGSTQVTLPNFIPPSTDSAFVEIRLR